MVLLSSIGVLQPVREYAPRVLVVLVLSPSLDDTVRLMPISHYMQCCSKYLHGQRGTT